MPERCLNCGFPCHPSDTVCPKCDEQLETQTDGSGLTVDIAHHGETIREALEKMETLVDQHRRAPTHYLRLIVGGDRIRLAAEQRAATMLRQGRVVQIRLRREKTRAA